MNETEQLKKILTDMQKIIDDAREKTTDSSTLSTYDDIEKIMNGKKVPKSLKICEEIECEDCVFFREGENPCKERLKFEGETQ